MPRRPLILLTAILSMMANHSSQAAAPGTPEKLPLWPGEAPIGNGLTAPSTASITVHLPEHPNGAAVVICPGGGYQNLVTGAEGHGIAAWLNSHGIAGIVLEYRLPKGNSFLPLADAQKAIKTTRARAGEWKIDPAKIGIIGFSAGGHLASTAGTHFSDAHTDSPDLLERLSSRPDFMILVYPVITMGSSMAHAGSRRNLLGENPTDEEIRRFSNETQVTDRTPPTFLAHASDDKLVPVANSSQFYAALESAKVKGKFLELPSGGHGLNGYKGPMWDAWQTQSLEWLKEIGMVR